LLSQDFGLLGRKWTRLRAQVGRYSKINPYHGTFRRQPQSTANFVADNFLSRSIIDNGKLPKLQPASPVRHAHELALEHELLIAPYPPIAELFTEPSALVMTGLSCRRVKTRAVSLGIEKIANLVNIFADLPCP
jgi:hypothetical protein